MSRAKSHNNTTITLSIPWESKKFLDQLAEDGYNRSQLILKLIDTIQVVYYQFPQVNLPRGINRINTMVKEGLLQREMEAGNLNPTIARDTEE